MDILMDDLYTFRDLGLHVKKGHEYPSIPSLTSKAKVIPGRPGAWDFGYEIGPRPFQIPLGFATKDLLKREAILSSINQFFLDARGKPRLIKMCFDYEPDKFILAKLQDGFTPLRTVSKAELTLTFIAYDPYKYSIIKNSELFWDNTALSMDSFTYYMDDEGTSASTLITASTVLNIEVLGHDIKPYIKIIGTGTSIMVRCGDAYVNVGTYAASKTIEIDCERYVAYINGVETMLDMNEFWLMRGSNDVSIIGVNMNFTVSFDYRDKWL